MNFILWLSLLYGGIQKKQYVSNYYLPNQKKSPKPSEEETMNDEDYVDKTHKPPPVEEEDHRDYSGYLIP